MVSLQIYLYQQTGHALRAGTTSLLFSCFFNTLDDAILPRFPANVGNEEVSCFTSPLSTFMVQQLHFA